MNAFESGRSIEARGMRYLLPFLREQSRGFVVNEKGPLARVLQESLGDLLFNRAADGKLISVEVKCEAEDRHGNLFLEIWSNRNLNDRLNHLQRGSNPGWLLKLRADLLWYYFISSDDLYVADLFQLQRWAFGYGDAPGSIWQKPQRRQGKYRQANDTWGIPVSIDELKRDVGLKVVRPRQLQLALFGGAAA